MKHDQYLRLIEEQRPDVANRGTDFKVTLAYKPREDSLEVKIYEKRYSISDVKALNMADKKILLNIKRNAAIEVFDKFYTDNCTSHE